MDKIFVFELVERMAALIRSEERKKCAEFGLQTVHLQALDYISRCNRYSDTPAALTRYLGLTKGTVSQTLQILVKKGFIEKIPDLIDKRMVHLKMLENGADILTKTQPHELFNHASRILEEQDFESYEEVFAQTLTALQKANNSQAFGLCKTCKYFTRSPDGFVCGLTKETLSQSDSEKICQEHAV